MPLLSQSCQTLLGPALHLLHSVLIIDNPAHPASFKALVWWCACLAEQGSAQSSSWPCSGQGWQSKDCATRHKPPTGPGNQALQILDRDPPQPKGQSSAELRKTCLTEGALDLASVTLCWPPAWPLGMVPNARRPLQPLHCQQGR